MLIFTQVGNFFFVLSYNLSHTNTKNISFLKTWITHTQRYCFLCKQRMLYEPLMSTFHFNYWCFPYENEATHFLTNYIYKKINLVRCISTAITSLSELDTESGEIQLGNWYNFEESVFFYLTLLSRTILKQLIWLFQLELYHVLRSSSGQNYISRHEKHILRFCNTVLIWNFFF